MTDTDDETINPIKMHQSNWPETYDALLLPFSLTLLRAYWAQQNRANRIFADAGFSQVEFDVLATLRRSPPPHALTPSDIQRAMLITSGGLTKVLRQLEIRGFVSRSLDADDRRIKPVVLTEQAMPILDRIMSQLITHVGGWIRRSLTEAEMTQLTALLGKIADAKSGTAN
ncbi:MAG: MarR family transcriptional regulator [Sulfuricellaceae bacterium]